MHRGFSVHELELAIWGGCPAVQLSVFTVRAGHFLAEFWFWMIYKAKIWATLICLWNLQDWENSHFFPLDSTKHWLNSSFLFFSHISSISNNGRKKFCWWKGFITPLQKGRRAWNAITRGRRGWRPLGVTIEVLFSFPRVAYSFSWVVLMSP